MASSSSSSRRKEKVARVRRNTNPSGWISDEGIRGKFLILESYKIYERRLLYRFGRGILHKPEQSLPTPAANHTAFIPQIDFEKYVVDQFRKKSERDERIEDTLLRWEKKGNKNGIGFETEDFDDESTDEDSMESSSLFFVRGQRTSSSSPVTPFEVKRIAAQQRQKINDTPHVLSRGGYALLEKKMRKRRAERLGLESPDLAPPPARHELWKATRTKSNGQFTSQSTQEIS
ncbi:hypothetical protein LR48_Vigan05g142500 [Vigna angularis]|uniref:Uncharacterized protein n=1 Tax=Phaseolus angularis TaxID=3914 RepID=A0A0L9ULM9_PHAAN|nr:hypothetical protein LR48_Vigan05g142500 [Vigna angularis]